MGGRPSCFTTPSCPSGSPDIESLKFTGKERDAETGLDYFGARYFSGAQGRFTSPDWSAKPQAVPYADLTDPQTLNLYGYVRNNPLRRADPDGHCSSIGECWDNVVAAYNYVKSVGYVKMEGGIGLGAEVKAGPVKFEAEAKNVRETKFQEPESTKTSVIEFAVKAEVGPVAGGLAASGEQPLAKGNEIITNGERDWHFLPGFDLGQNGKESGWDFGLGAKIGVGIQLGAEVGVNGQKVLSDLLNVLTVPPPPSAPAPPSPPAASDIPEMNYTK